ncbi:hypothetical protein TI04_09675, partial [Achromatium sp. WMS2]
MKLIVDNGEPDKKWAGISVSLTELLELRAEAGFKQYLNRALNNGATPNEVLDALLMAFPVLGLAKIVW